MGTGHPVPALDRTRDQSEKAFENPSVAFDIEKFFGAIRFGFFGSDQCRSMGFSILQVVDPRFDLPLGPREHHFFRCRWRIGRARKAGQKADSGRSEPAD